MASTSLYSNKYPNNSRIVSGTPDIFPNDIVLLCDTSSGPVTINLLTIPSNYWNTQWQMYIVDNSNNAFAHNITINAGSGQKINNNNSLTINVNNGLAVVKIGANGQYVAELNSLASVGYQTIQDEGTSLPQRTILNFIGSSVSATDDSANGRTNVTINANNTTILSWADLNNLITNSTLEVGNFYVINDPTNAVYVILQALTTNSIAQNGSGYFLNADYQSVGNYAGVPSFAGQTGIWNSVGTYGIGQVCIYNNKHYVNISGTNTGIPSSTPSDWTELAKNLTNGYIAEVNFVNYNLDSNLVISRLDSRNNYVEYYSNIGITLNDFPFGNDKVTNNKVIGASYVAFQNTNNNYTYNTIINGRLNDSTNPSVGGNALISKNYINDSYISISSALGNISDNTLNSESYISINSSMAVGCEVRYNNISQRSYIIVSQLLGTAKVNENTIFANSYISSVNKQFNNGFLLRNIISGNSFISLTSDTTSTGCWENTLNSYSSMVFNGSHTGNIRGNNLNLSSSLTIGTSSGGSDISGNELFCFSTMTIVNNISQIASNKVRFQSSINVTGQTGSGYITSNCATNNSTIAITSLNSTNDVIGNYADNNSQITLGTVTGPCYYNNAKNGAIINITTIAVGGVFNYNSALNNGQFQLASVSASATYCSAEDGQIVKQNITTTLLQCKAKRGYSNYTWSLDMSSGSVYTGTTLTIPSDQSYVGIFTLTNCGAKVISTIINSPSKNRFMIQPGDTTIVLNPIAITLAVANNLVANHYTNVGGGANTLSYRALGSDNFICELTGSLVGIVEKNSWA